jgi:hypothetical protein
MITADRSMGECWIGIKDEYDTLGTARGSPSEAALDSVMNV